MEIYKRCLAVIVCTSAFDFDVFGAIVNEVPTAINQLSIRVIEIGDVNNKAYDDNGDKYGQVGYKFWVSEAEFSNKQFVKILNEFKDIAFTHGFYNTNMGNINNHGGIKRNGTNGDFDYETLPDQGDKPLNFVNPETALMVCNLMNGSSDPREGAYDITYYENGTMRPESWERRGEVGFYLILEDEYVKSAYYDRAKQDYNTDPLQGNFGSELIDVDSGNYTSPYGVKNMGGNVSEMMGTLIDDMEERMVSRGGNMNSKAHHTRINKRYSAKTTSLNSVLGIRLIYIPEPSTYSGILGGLALAIAIMRRKRRRCL